MSSARVSSRAKLRVDRSGDPLDGLVNLFDLGIVLAVAFLLAALQSVNLTELLTRENVTVVRTDASGQTLIVKEGDQLKTVRLTSKTVTGPGRARRRRVPPQRRPARLRQAGCGRDVDDAGDAAHHDAAVGRPLSGRSACR